MTLKPFFISAIVVAVAGMIQRTTLLDIFGVKPNLVLALLVTLPLFLEFAWHYFGIMLFAITTIRFRSWFELSLLGLLMMAIVSYGAYRIAPSRPVVTALVLTSLGTALFYLISDFSFILHRWDLVLGEIVYNTVIAGALFFAFATIKNRA